MRIDEDRRRDRVGPPLRLFDQRHVPGVERTHRRHQRERPSPLQLAERARQFFTGANRLHAARASDNL